MADYSKSQLVRRMAESPFFAIQLDESTDVTNFPQLLVYVRYIYDFEMIEDFLFCKPLEGRTTSVEIFKVLNDFIEQYGISWEKCVGVCSDGARAMTGRHSGVVTRIQSVAPNAVFTHCSIHREALAARTLQSSFKDVLDNAIKVVNLIKARALTCLQLCATICALSMINFFYTPKCVGYRGGKCFYGCLSSVLKFVFS